MTYNSTASSLRMQCSASDAPLTMNTADHTQVQSVCGDQLRHRMQHAACLVLPLCQSSSVCQPARSLQSESMVWRHSYDGPGGDCLRAQAETCHVGSVGCNARPSRQFDCSQDLHMGQVTACFKGNCTLLDRNPFRCRLAGALYSNCQPMQILLPSNRATAAS